MSKKAREDKDDENDNALPIDDLRDVKAQLKKLKKDSDDGEESDDDGESMIIADEAEEDEKAIDDDIVINEDHAISFEDEDKFYKALEKFNKDIKEGN